MNNLVLSSPAILIFREFFLAVLTEHTLAIASSIELHDFAHQQLLLLDGGYCLRSQALQSCQSNGAEGQQDVRATGLENLRQMVRAGTGITFMPKIAIHEPEDGIRYVPFQAPTPQRIIGLVWRKTTSRKELLERQTKLMTP